ncbi:MAG: hypothetical protein NVSMB14_08680 [Isosphaeraceae bacterium]
MFEYLIRHGVTRGLGRFGSEWGDLEPGEKVIARSERGKELGEVVLRVEACSEGNNKERRAWVEQKATASDIEIWRGLEKERQRRFEICLEVARAGDWPIEPIDVEPLFDRTVLQYLGPRRFEGSADLVARLRATKGLDVFLEPAGLDELQPEQSACGGGGCGSCGSRENEGSSETSAGHACASCPLSR